MRRRRRMWGGAKPGEVQAKIAKLESKVGSKALTAEGESFDGFGDGFGDGEQMAAEGEMAGEMGEMGEKGNMGGESSREAAAAERQHATEGEAVRRAEWQATQANADGAEDSDDDDN